MDESNSISDIVVAGFGSPHGDDQAGWEVIAKLARRANNAVTFVTIREGSQLIGELEGCRKLIIVDACCTASKLRLIKRFRWPDSRIRQYHNHSTHGIGVCNALQLADRLGRIPPDVEVFGIEVSDLNLVGELSSQIDQAVEEVAEIILAELYEAAHA